jgi:hypothetical protein
MKRANQMRSKSRVLPCLAMAIALSGCQRVQEAVSTTPKIGVVALFDISASTDQDSLRQRYQTEFMEIVSKLATHDGLIVRADAIRATPLAETTFPIRIDMARMNVVNRNDVDLDDAVKKVNGQVQQALADLFSQNPATQQTRILDAIEVTGRIFNGEDMKGIADRRLVVFSDMIESSDRYEFTRAYLSDKAIESMIQKDRQNGRVPSLGGVHVWAAGAGAGGGSGLSGDRLRAIEQFWQEYFRAAGADLIPTRYGATLLNFNLTL